MAFCVTAVFDTISFFLNGTAVFDDVANFFWTEVRLFPHLFPGIQGILGVGVGLGYSGRGLALYT
jgi:hypothetical protein